MRIDVAAQDLSNPYDFSRSGTGFLGGRHKEKQEIEYYFGLATRDAGRYFNLALVGKRAIGKTSMLNVAAEIAGNLRLLSVTLSHQRRGGSSNKGWISTPRSTAFSCKFP